MDGSAKTVMQVRSTSFAAGQTIPARHTGFGEDLSPELIVDGIPEGTRSLAVILDDLDAIFQKGEFTHWIAWNIPPTGTVPEGIPAGASISQPVEACQGKAWGEHVYRGPKPPRFTRKAHRYRFTVYALDTMLDISTDSDKAALVEAMDAHVLAQAELFGMRSAH